MADTSFNIRVDREVKDAFVQAARANNRSASLLLRDFMIEYTERQKRLAEAAIAPVAAKPAKRRAA